MGHCGGEGAGEATAHRKFYPVGKVSSCRKMLLEKKFDRKGIFTLKFTKPG